MLSEVQKILLGVLLGPEDPTAWRKYRARCWQEANREKCAEYGRARRTANLKRDVEYQIAYRKTNANKMTEYGRAYYRKNADKISKQSSARYAANPEKYAERGRSWRLANPERKRGYERNRMRSDPVFRVVRVLRCRLNQALGGKNKSAPTQVLLGCTPEFLKSYLESKFQPGMSWERRGEIHIDHIRPCASFDLSDPEQQKQCFHYTNLQPLWAADNLRKSDKYGP